MEKNKIKKNIGLALTILGIGLMVYTYVTTDDMNNVLLGLMLSSGGMLLSGSAEKS